MAATKKIVGPTREVNQERFDEARERLRDAGAAFDVFYSMVLCAMDADTVLNPYGLSQLLEGPASNIREGLIELEACAEVRP